MCFNIFAQHYELRWKLQHSTIHKSNNLKIHLFFNNTAIQILQPDISTDNKVALSHKPYNQEISTKTPADVSKYNIVGTELLIYCILNQNVVPHIYRDEWKRK